MILGFSESWLSDKLNLRAPFFLFNTVLTMIGILVLGYAIPNGARYFGAMLVVAGAYANIPFCMTYLANNIVGQWKRAFASAVFVACSGMGGIIGTLTFRTQDKPDYK